VSTLALAAGTAGERAARRRRALVLLGAAVLAALALGVFVGSVGVSPGEMAGALLARLAGSPQDSLAAILLDLRLPRALVAASVGGMLALSGALLQSLLRNPLADPYVLGVSGGAALAATAALAMGLGAGAIGLASAAGALAALVALLAIARQAMFGRGAGEGETGANSVLLAGVMIGSLCLAALGVALALAPDGRLRGIVFWMMGDLGGVGGGGAALVALLAWGLLFAAARTDAAALELLQRGELQAFSQGVRTGLVQRRQIVVSALATGIAVSLAGAIGFVGFVAPHLVRHHLGSDPRIVLPASTLLGAVLVLLADTVARSLQAPIELPVGAVTAMIGVPVFLWQLQRK
jgi:iron complex transport system permease protein